MVSRLGVPGNAGLSDAPVTGILLDNVSITTSKGVDVGASCSECTAKAINPPAGRPADPCQKEPAPPPAPQPACKMLSKLGCFNVSDCISCSKGPVLPLFEPKTHDKTTIEVCAAACSAVHRPVAGIEGGNHCYCGALADLSGADAKRRSRPADQCEATACRGSGGSKEKCGGEGILLAYSFACA